MNPPVSVVAGTTITPELTISVEDKSGHVVATDNSMVTIALRKGSSGGEFAAGTLTVQAVSGVATFSDLIVDVAGQYTLVVVDGLLKEGKSKTFKVLADASTAALVITQSPGDGGFVGQKLFPLAVALKDSFGNLVTGTRADTIITLTTEPDGGRLRGKTHLSLASGTATFRSLNKTKG